MTTHSPTDRRLPDLLAALHGGIVVSCQAQPGNPLHGPDLMAVMARAAELGGARGIRANGAEDVAAIRRATDLPVIGIVKRDYPDSAVYITPTVAEVREVARAGAQIVALDGTRRPRPNGVTLAQCVAAAHAEGALAFADLATTDDLRGAIDAGIDAVGTTLSGYTAESTPSVTPDFDLLHWLVRHSPVPIYAEGRLWTPDEAREALTLGASFVVIGTAITNPMAITSRFVAGIATTSEGASLS